MIFSESLKKNRDFQTVYSVVRHRLARLIRESYRLSETRFHSGYDIVVIARPVAKDKNYFEVESALLHLGKVHKIAG